MTVSVLQYCIKTLENLPSEMFKHLQESVRTYIKHEETCEILLKIDPEKLQKKFKSEPSSLHFQSRRLAGLLTLELGVELIRWIQQTPPLPFNADETACAPSSLPDETACESSSFPDERGDHPS
jgi:hypothetical protein